MNTARNLHGRQSASLTAMKTMDKSQRKVTPNQVANYKFQKSKSKQTSAVDRKREHRHTEPASRTKGTGHQCIVVYRVPLITCNRIIEEGFVYRIIRIICLLYRIKVRSTNFWIFFLSESLNCFRKGDCSSPLSVSRTAYFHFRMHFI